MNPDLRGLSRFEKNLDHTFQDRQLLITALTHKSFPNENPGLEREDNERLEFLGDAALSLIISQHLYKKFPELNEGELSKIRAHLVNENSLAKLAAKIDIGPYLFLGKGEEGTGGREKASLLSDALEAVIAGVYLDRGIRYVTSMVLAHFQEMIEDAVGKKNPFDFKTTFQELCQERFGILPEYHLTRMSGPDHNRIFVMELMVNGDVFGTGNGKSKKEAQQQLTLLKKCDPDLEGYVARAL
jgi:ribonuclease-3